MQWTGSGHCETLSGSQNCTFAYDRADELPPTPSCAPDGLLPLEVRAAPVVGRGVLVLNSLADIHTEGTFKVTGGIWSDCWASIAWPLDWP
jgi:hypothetical protein